MSSAQEHYENHLAAVYVWMAGGVDAAITRGQHELEEHGHLRGGARHAVDGALSMRVSASQKLRLQPGWIEAQLTRCGFSVAAGNGLAGMRRVIAVKP
jgi:hypothetical protein